MMDTIFYTDPYTENHLTRPGDFYFDIETTGLRRYEDYAWVWGYSTVKEKSIHSKQVYISAKDEEERSISLLREDLESSKRIITYNGRHFDIPFLDARAKIYGIELPWPEEHVDLYQITRAHSKFLQIRHLSLKLMEERMQIERNDPLGGKDTLKLYAYVQKTGDERLKRALLNHNYYDIKNLIPLMGIIRVIEKQKVLVTKYGRHRILDFYQRGNTLLVMMELSHTDTLQLFSPHHRIRSKAGICEIQIPLKKASLQGRPVQYLPFNGKVVAMDDFFFPIIKEEIHRILTENQL